MYKINKCDADKCSKYDQNELERNMCLPNASPAPQVQSKLMLLKVLLAKNVTHVRVTGASWPAPMKKYIKKRRTLVNLSILQEIEGRCC